MSYDYETKKPEILTDEGHRLFIKARDRVIETLKVSGAIRMAEFISIITHLAGAIDGWVAMAYIDRMVEIGDLMEVTGPKAAGQYRVFVTMKD